MSETFWGHDDHPDRSECDEFNTSYHHTIKGAVADLQRRTRNFFLEDGRRVWIVATPTAAKVDVWGKNTPTVGFTSTDNRMMGLVVAACDDVTFPIGVVFDLAMDLGLMA